MTPGDETTVARGGANNGAVTPASTAMFGLLGESDTVLVGP